ncbi:MAG: NADPH-dependent F420 reductase [archaeon]|uniref:Reduced coenzyme F420:NADP oxidoreductase n=1 Tax=Methanobrevibacter gottschalkii DSM 11977 TaxID=1122229 RepID=A0A3N5B160_9EURY|nr:MULTISPECIES: NADPH-dependent F420 reductase [Methanobrevibacter]MCQ2970583.1 NADPH-dependent F420 reductase [archaeon]OEC96956.1 NADPH-dependent F420 reductase [Methanobrevibacter sp. A27]RPF50953.1 reduced coenzyme F420:NADP oxidoreductase [Methanobrevibacter gottschalkii DSM 11977]
MIVSVIGGTGPQGLGIAERLAIAGLEVIVGSRKEEKALDIVAKAKEEFADYDLNMTGMANEDAAKAGDVLIITVPLAAQKPTLEGIKEFCNDKIVMDATVPLETAIGGKPFRFVDLMEGSAAERTASILKGTGAKVICAFCNISNSHLANIPEEIDCDCLIAGDDKESKEIAAEIIDKIPGVKTIDCGILEKARIIEKITPLLIGLNIKYKSHYGGLRITGIPALDKE